MGIYGHKLDEFAGNQNSNIIIEMEVDKEFIDFILEEQELLQEETRANITLKDDKTKVVIMLRDKVTVTRNGACGHSDSVSFKIRKPDKLTNKYGNIDIIIPGYNSSKSKEESKPYIDKKVESKFNNGEIPEEVKLALKFADQEQKFIRLIYQNPDTENQKKLFRQMIKDSNYIIDFEITSDKKFNKELHDKLGVNKNE